VCVRPPVLAAAFALSAAAQTLLPARPGVILYREGQAWLNGAAVEISAPRWVEMRPSAMLTTGHGRAELLVNPCTLLRLDGHGALRMVVNSLTAARLELVAGSAVIEADGGSRTGSVELVIQHRVVRVAQSGVYRFDSVPPRLRVYYGAAEVEGVRRRIAGGRSVDLTDAAISPFDRKQIDALQQWSDLRSWQLMDESGILAQSGRPRICAP